MRDKVLRLQHVALPFPGTPESVDDARRFYSGTLGLRELGVPGSLEGSVLWFAVADQELHLFAEASGVAANDQTRRHPCFQVADVAATRAQLELNGLETIDGNPPIEGRPRFFVLDPFGNALEFVQIVS